jgi:hypothetical protein
MAWLKTATTKIEKGDVYVEWAELGKTPYAYWKNNEPNDLKRICELAKPWLILKPRIQIALEGHDAIATKNLGKFNSWWSNYSDIWCKHWGLDSWTIENMSSVVVFGKVTEIDLLVSYLERGVVPTRILL